MNEPFFFVLFTKNGRQIFKKAYPEFEMAITQIAQLQRNNYQTLLQIL